MNEQDNTLEYIWPIGKRPDQEIHLPADTVQDLISRYMDGQGVMYGELGSPVQKNGEDTGSYFVRSRVIDPASAAVRIVGIGVERDPDVPEQLRLRVTGKTVPPYTSQGMELVARFIASSSAGVIEIITFDLVPKD